MPHYIAVVTDKANQTRADLWRDVARVKLRQGEPDKAVAFFAQAKTLDPKLEGIDKELAAAEVELKRAATTRPAMTQPTTAPIPAVGIGGPGDPLRN